MTLLLEEVLVGARTIYGEARDQPYEGMKAIGHVLINRTQLKKGDADHSIAAAALRWLQFSAWNENDPNRERLELVTVDNPKYRLAIRAMLEAIDELDFTLGARWYHTTMSNPKWSQGKQACLTIGGHEFYNNID